MIIVVIVHKTRERERESNQNCEIRWFSPACLYRTQTERLYLKINVLGELHQSWYRFMQMLITELRNPKPVGEEFLNMIGIKTF